MPFPSVFSVDCVGSGVGKRLIEEAESFAVAHGCTKMNMVLVNLRKEDWLIKFYEKHGYKQVKLRVAVVAVLPLLLVVIVMIPQYYRC